MIVVLGATGNTGRIVAEKLLEKGEQVRVVGRSEKGLAPLAALGAEALAGDSADAAFLTRAFTGAEAVYTLIPPDAKAADYRAHQRLYGEAAAKAIRASGVKRVVFLSSLGADLAAGAGPISGLHEQEERLQAIPGLDLLLLRPGYFYENHFGTLGLIRHQGINGGAIGPQVPIVMIAARDIGEAAASALLTRDWKGVEVRELYGPRDLTMAEATRIVGSQIGKPELAYVQFPEAAFVDSLVQQAGFSRSMAEGYGEMTRAFNEGRVRSVHGRSPATTGSTRFEDFAGTLAAAYRAL